MLRFVIQKIRSKGWLNLCLLLGIVLIVSVFSCHPMIEKGAGNQVLQHGFETGVLNNQEFPAVISKKTSYSFVDNNRGLQAVYGTMEENEKNWCKALGIDKILSQNHVYFSGDSAKSQYSDKIHFFSVGVLQDMESHVQIVKGDSLQNTKMENGAYPCIISEQVMDSTKLVVGEHITLTMSGDNKENPIEFVVVGICKEKSNADNYWHNSLSDIYKTLFVTDEVFDEIISNYNVENLRYEQNTLINYQQINYDNSEICSSGIEKCIAADKDLDINFYDTLKEFQSEKKTIRILLWALEIPCIVLLLIFLYMVSTQIINSEENEIAVLRSRGISVKQIMILYLLHSIIMSLMGAVLGIALGFAMCKSAASTDAFLTFVNKDLINYRFTWEMLLYGVAACVIVIVFITVPVWKKANLTIVSQNNTDDLSTEKPVMEKFYVDFILLGIAVYLLHNYRKQMDELSESIINKEAIDPMIFLVASVFVFACSLIFIRLLKYIINVTDKIGKKHWKPAMYVSFLHIRRNYYKQGFLSMFLIMTIATGIFNSNMARTVNENSERRINYNVGADAKLMEKWTLFTGIIGDSVQWSYEEKNFDPFYIMEEEGICHSVTKVITDENATIRANNTDLDSCMLMGIHTKEFGETARLQKGLNDTHWFNSLNALAKDVDGVIISRNVSDNLDIYVGDSLKLIRYSPISTDEPEAMGLAEVKVSAVVDCFPGYERYTYMANENGRIVEKENYLIVANYAMVLSTFGHTPYSIWMRMEDDITSKQLITYLEDKEIQVDRIDIAKELVNANRNMAMVQITNGMFTMSFIISLIICSVGFMIYWIMSIKNRQMIFGVYRAMGMRMREVYVMLFNEHFYSSFLSIIVGGIVGMLATKLFTRLITVVYLPRKHNIEIEVFTDRMDMVKLFSIIFIVVTICFIILQQIIRKMKIEQALKM